MLVTMMASIICSSFALIFLNAFLSCSGLPTTFTPSTSDADGNVDLTTEVSSVTDTWEVIFSDSETNSFSNVTAGSSSFDSLKDYDFSNWNVSDDSSSVPELFRLMDAVDVSDMNSSGEETAENVLHEHRLNDPQSDELKDLLENLQSVIIDANLFTRRNTTELDDVSSDESVALTSVDVFRGDSTSSEETSLPFKLLNSTSLDDLKVNNHTEIVNDFVEVESETNDFQMFLNDENVSIVGNRSFLVTKSESDSEIVNSTEIWHTGAAVREMPDKTADDLNRTLNPEFVETIPVGAGKYSSETDFTTTSKAESETASLQTEASDTSLNSSISVGEQTTVFPNVTNTVSAEQSCPTPGSCILWFLARHSCQGDEDCNGSLSCCSAGLHCSRTCIALT